MTNEATNNILVIPRELQEAFEATAQSGPETAPEVVRNSVDTDEFCRMLGTWANENSVIPDNHKRYQTVIDKIVALCAQQREAGRHERWCEEVNADGVREENAELRKQVEEQAARLSALEGQGQVADHPGTRTVYDWLCFVERSGTPDAILAAGVLKAYYEGVDLIEATKNIAAAFTGKPHEIAGLGSLTDEDDGVVTLRFQDEAAAQQFMNDYWPTVDHRDMPHVPETVAAPQGELTPAEIDDMVFGYAPSCQIGEGRNLVSAILAREAGTDSHNFDICQRFHNWLVSQDLLSTPHTEESDGPLAPALNWIASVEPLILDAARWRGFLGSARIKPQGSAGLSRPEGDGYYAHLGLEIWTVHGRDYNQRLLDEMDSTTALGRRWLTAYADIAAKVFAECQDTQPGAQLPVIPVGEGDA